MDRTTLLADDQAKEDSLNPYSNGIWIERMEKISVFGKDFKGLNPYSNGIWIEREFGGQVWFRTGSLNPYSNGIWIEHSYLLVI